MKINSNGPQLCLVQIHVALTTFFSWSTRRQAGPTFRSHLYAGGRNQSACPSCTSQGLFRLDHAICPFHITLHDLSGPFSELSVL